MYGQSVLNNIYDRHTIYISQESKKTAAKVIKDIVLSLDKAINNLEFYRADKFKQNNDGSYRAFEKHNYRVSYRFGDDTIRVLRVRHTSREPKNY